MLKLLNFHKTIRLISRPVYTSHVLKTEEVKGPKKKNTKRKVKETVELITLLDANGKIMGLKGKSDSKNLANKLNLTLQKVEDTRFGKMYPTYKLVPNADVFKKDEGSNTSAAKKLKKLPLNSRISDNDLLIKVKTIQNWLEKNCEVHIAVSSSGDSESLRNNILKKLQEQLKDICRIVNTRTKDEILKFILLPSKKIEKTAPSKQKLEKSDDIYD